MGKRVHKTGLANDQKIDLKPRQRVNSTTDWGHIKSKKKKIVPNLEGEEMLLPNNSSQRSKNLEGYQAKAAFTAKKKLDLKHQKDRKNKKDSGGAGGLSPQPPPGKVLW